MHFWLQFLLICFSYSLSHSQSKNFAFFPVYSDVEQAKESQGFEKEKVCVELLMEYFDYNKS